VFEVIMPPADRGAMMNRGNASRGGRIERLATGAACLMLALSCAGLNTGAAAAGADVPRTNVVFILLDNCGQEWLGCYGSDEGRTPRIDALARTGVRFEHCYTPPVCGPSRTVLLTGRYLLRSGFLLHHDAALYSGGGLDPQSEVILARPFRAAGYVTGLAGKWQINNLYDEPGILDRHGFEEHLVWPGSIDRDRIGEADLSRFRAAIDAADVATTTELTQRIESRYWDPVVVRNGRREVHRDRFGPDVLQEFALDFLKRHKDRPFFLYYPMVLTHGRTHTDPVVPTPLNRRPGRPPHEMYGEMVQYADRLVGELVDRLEELGLHERTVVFVATDNGSEESLIARRGGKEVHGGLYQLTEAGSDVALVANCPARFPGGRTVPLADFSDVFPTLCELAGVPLPAGVVLDGRSQAAVLLGLPGAVPPRDWIFNQYGRRRAVRDRQYKLYSTGEFYDVANDRAEQNDLAHDSDAARAAARERLRQALASLPPDAPPPFKLLSQSAFKLRQAGQPAP
jgi:arylsulfatase A-like enzyme